MLIFYIKQIAELEERLATPPWTWRNSFSEPPAAIYCHSQNWSDWWLARLPDGRIHKIDAVFWTVVMQCCINWTFNKLNVCSASGLLSNCMWNGTDQLVNSSNCFFSDKGTTVLLPSDAQHSQPIVELHQKSQIFPFSNMAVLMSLETITFQHSMSMVRSCVNLKYCK